MGRPSILQSLIIAIMIFVFITIFIFHLFEDYFVRAFFMILAFGALLRVVYQMIRPPEVEVEGDKEPEGLDRSVPKKVTKGTKEDRSETIGRSGPGKVLKKDRATVKAEEGKGSKGKRPS